MKKISKIIIIVVIFALFSISASAKEPEDHISDFEEILPEGFEGITNGASLSESVGLPAVLSEVLSILKGEGAQVLAFLFFLLGAAIIYSIAELYSEHLQRAVCTGVGISLSLAVFLRVAPLFFGTISSLEEANRFFGSLIPVFSAVSVSAGSVSSGASCALGMNFALSFFGSIASVLLSALVSFCAALTLLSALDKEGTSAIISSARGLYLWVLGICSALIMGTLALQTVISSARDSAAMRAAKYAAGGMIPIVGGMVAGALSTLTSGLVYVKSIIGIGAIFVILSVMLSPLVMLILYRTALSIAISFASAFSKGASGLFLSLRSCLDLLISTYAIMAVVYIFEIILFIFGGVGTV